MNLGPGMKSASLLFGLGQMFGHPVFAGTSVPPAASLRSVQNSGPVGSVCSCPLRKWGHTQATPEKCLEDYYLHAAPFSSQSGHRRRT
jgi:hypothetical protein